MISLDRQAMMDFYRLINSFSEKDLVCKIKILNQSERSQIFQVTEGFLKDRLCLVDQDVFLETTKKLRNSLFKKDKSFFLISIIKSLLNRIYLRIDSKFIFDNIKLCKQHLKEKQDIIKKQEDLCLQLWRENHPLDQPPKFDTTPKEFPEDLWPKITTFNATFYIVQEGEKRFGRIITDGITTELDELSTARMDLIQLKRKYFFAVAALNPS